MYEFIPSPNKSSRQGQQVIGIIAHFTAGGSLNGTVRYSCNKIKAPEKFQGKDGGSFVLRDGITYYNAKSAAHYYTGREGRTVRLVAENESAWHAGSSTTIPSLNGKKSVNLWSIGHEICNWGALLKRDGKFYCWPGNYTKEYKGPDPIYSPKKYSVAQNEKSYFGPNGEILFPAGVIEYWEPYTEEQIKATITLWQDIVDRYNIKREWVAGHEDVDPTRKIDPGPAFPWTRIIGEVYPSSVVKNSDLLQPIDDEIDVEEEIPTRYIDDDRGKKSNICTSLLNKFFG